MRFGIAIVLVALVGGFDAATGSEISFSIFYLLPVAFAGGLLARSAGTVVAVLSAAVWGYLEITKDLHFPVAGRAAEAWIR